MALETVPWFVGGGAEHSPNVARMVAYAATSGAAGVLGSLDFRVLELDVPGTSVRVMPGGAAIPNGYLPAPEHGKESYITRSESETEVAVTATGSGAGRSDLVVVRVDDPQFGGQVPVDPTVGPYVRFEIIENVNPTTTDVPADLGYPAVALARIDLPAQTGTVEQGMITNLRKVAQPKRTRDLYNTQPTSTNAIVDQTYKTWTPQATRVLSVPKWATQVKIVGHLGGVVCRNGDAIGFVRPKFGTLVGQETAFDLDANSRSALLVSDTLTVPASARGTTVTLTLDARYSNATGSVETDIYSTVLWDIEFLEAASSD